MTVWCNGRLVTELTLDPAERGLMLGDGIFETLAVRDGRPVWLSEHLARMQQAAMALGLPFDRPYLDEAVSAILEKSSAPSEVLRITLTRGPTARGLAAEATQPSLILALSSFDRSKLPPVMRLITSTIRRNASSLASCHKTLSYIDAIAAAREAKGRADDALMLNTDGYVASSTVANIFLLNSNTLITPAHDQGILRGITRAELIRDAQLLGLQVEERAVTSAECAAAEAVFLTNSLRLAVPVTAIDGQPCGQRDIEFITHHLERSFS